VLFIAGEAHLLGAEPKEDGADVKGADLAKAESYYRRLIGEHADDQRVPRSQLRIGWLLYRSDKLEDAARHLGPIAGKLSDPEHKAEAYLLLGRVRLKNQQADQAIGQLQQAIAAKGDWARLDEALLLLAQAYREEDKPKEAVEHLSRLESQFKQSPHRAHALYLLGETAQQQSQWDQAADRYQMVLQEYGEDPSAPLAAYGLGAVRIAQGQYEAAEQAFSNLLSKYDSADTRALAMYWRGVARHRLKKFEPAGADLKQFVAEAEKSQEKPVEAKLPDALYTLALCQIGQNQLPAAGTTLATLLKDHPDYAQRDKAYYELGHALLGEQKRAEAAAAFGSLIEASPESPLAAEAYFHLGSWREQLAASDDGESQVKAQELAAAEAAFAKGLKAATEPAMKEKLQYKLGDMQFRQENFADAAETLQGQLKEFPQGELLGPARYLAAESLFKLKQFDQALPLFEQVAAEKVEPYTAQAYYRAGAAAAAAKNWSGSEKAYRSLLSQQADFPLAAEARYGLALALQNQNQHDEAVKLYEQIAANSTSETAAKARFMVGEIAFGKKEYDRAIEHFLETAAGYPYPEWQGLARLEAGRCFMQLNKPDQAKKQFQIIVEQFANHDKAADAARLLAELNK
jgi:cellulose synthase operon protein C